MSWYLEVLKKYAVFRGRARRREYWFFTLFNALAVILLSIIDATLGLDFRDEASTAGLLTGVYSLAVLIPTLAVTVRGLHDTGRTGWWILINLIPLIGGIVLFIFAILDSQPGNNRFGPNPKGMASRVA